MTIAANKALTSADLSCTRSGKRRSSSAWTRGSISNPVDSDAFDVAGYIGAPQGGVRQRDVLEVGTVQVDARQVEVVHTTSLGIRALVGLISPPLRL